MIILLPPLQWTAAVEMGTSIAKGLRFPLPNRSYPDEREPARSSPTNHIAPKAVAVEYGKIIRATVCRVQIKWMNNGHTGKGTDVK